MGFLNKIRNFSFKGKINASSGITSIEEAIRNYSFMEWRPGNGLPDICIDLDSITGITEAYNKCSSIATIINRNSSALINGKWWLTDKKDNDVLNKYKGIAALLDKPNPIQSWSEFLMLVDVYRQLYGEAFVYAVVPDGFSLQDASALWAVNPNYVSIKLSGKMYLQSNAEEIIEGYILNVNGTAIEVDRRYMLHIRDVNQNVNMSANDIRGRSRLVGLDKSVRNIIQAEEAIYALNKNRGAQGILANKTSDKIGHQQIDDEEKERIQRKFNTNYGLRSNQDTVIITNADLSWQQMSFNVKDLMLFEGMENNIKRIAEAFNYPFELLNTTNIAYSNKVEAKRELYQGNIIPVSKIYAEKFTSFFGLDRAFFVIDFAEVECLKKTETEKAETLYKQNQALKIAYEKGIISLAEWRLAIGMNEEIYKPDEPAKNVTGNEQETGENRSEESNE
nr:MAG TPA: portal protein [Caudoviricetes sp.]